MSRYTRVKSAPSSFSASLTQRHYKGSSEYSRDASTELLGHPNWAANLLALTRSASWFVKSLDSQKKNLALMAISLFPSKIFWKKSFPSICQTEEQEEGTFVFSFEFFSQFLSFFIYLFIPPLFILLLSLEWRTETSNTLAAVGCSLPLMHQDSSSSPSIFLHASRHVTTFSIAFRAGKTATKNENKANKIKEKNLFWGGRRLWYNTATTQRVVHVENIFGPPRPFQLCFRLFSLFETTFFLRPLLLLFPTDSRQKQNWMMFIPIYFESYSLRRSWN